MNTKNYSNIKDLFVKGDLKSLYIHYQKKLFKPADRKWLLAMLCLMGKMEEALIFTKKEKLTSFDYFFLTMVFTRKSEYEKAKSYLKLLFQNKNQGPEEEFFYYQAMSFYSFFHCRYRISLSFALKSHLSSMQLEENFWKILSLDLLGHIEIHMGDIHLGLFHLEEALNLAKILENKAFEQATFISILSYQSQYSLNPLEISGKILKCLKKIAATDNYSEGLLTLSLAHLYLLLGQMQLADKMLVKSQSIIFGYNLSRHKGSWHFERGYYYYLQGRNELALIELDLSLKNIQIGIDLRLELKILGLKRKILLSLHQEVETLTAKILSLTKKMGNPSSINKLAREGLMNFEGTQDPLQKLFDDFNSTKWEKTLSDIISFEYFGLIRDKIQSKLDHYLLLGLWKNGAIFISKENVLAQKKGMSDLILKTFLLLNSNTRVSKADLIQKLWGYDYEPQRHDTMIYALIHRLREAMGTFESSLIGEDHHYRLVQHFKVLHLKPSFPILHEEKNILPLLTDSNSWNIRQHRCLMILKNGTPLQVSDYSREFSVTKMTALRDLRQLLSAGVIKKFGRARATIYSL